MVVVPAERRIKTVDMYRLVFHFFNVLNLTLGIVIFGVAVSLLLAGSTPLQMSNKRQVRTKVAKKERKKEREKERVREIERDSNIVKKRQRGRDRESERDRDGERERARERERNREEREREREGKRERVTVRKR